MTLLLKAIFYAQTFVSIFQDIEEGSGNEAYDYSSSSVFPIVPSRALDEVRPPPPPRPTSSYSPFDEDDSQITTLTDDSMENSAPYVQKKLQKFPVTAGKSIR